MKKLFTMFAALVLVAAFAFAHGGEHRGKAKRDHAAFGEKMAEKLGLSEGQKIQARELHEKFRAENEPFHEAMMQKRDQLREARKAGDTARVEALRAEMETQRAAMQERHEAMKAQFLTILTPDQKAKFEEMEKNREERKGKRGMHRRH